ncbi:tail sheath protein [uncultured Caudovirales phage]|uniref:Tail sheath protein n=1 Tax=uncultured Caudovirales phage TaxID=2100421 RepID=A0A6J7WSS9_9CAUD|nr:tail sheath protein [uncultured Caudovirales phage]
MPFQVSPGVNVSEIDLTTIVPAVSSTSGAIGGVFKWGPIEDRVLISSEDQLVSTFGKPTANNYETFFSAANFLAYGNSLYVSRAAANSYNAIANTGLARTTDNPDVAANANVFIKNIGDYEYQKSTYETSVWSNVFFVAKYAGEYGNSLRLSVCPSAAAYESGMYVYPGSNVEIKAITQQANSIGYQFHIDVGSAVANVSFNCNSNTDFAELAATSFKTQIKVGDIILVGNTVTGSQYMEISAIGSNVNDDDGFYQSNTFFNLTFTDTFKQRANLTETSWSTDSRPGNTAATTVATRYWKYFNLFDSAPGVSNYVATRTSNTSIQDEVHVVVIDQRGKITGLPGQILEVHPRLSRAIDARGEQGGTIYYRDKLNTYSEYVWSTRDLLVSAYTSDAFPACNTSLTGVATYDFSQGQDGQDENDIPIQYLAQAYDKFKSAEDVDVSLIVTGKSRGGIGEVLPNYIIDNIAETRRDCVVFVSPALEDSVNVPGRELTNITEFRNALRSTSYAVLDSGYKYQYDKYNDVYRWVPMNGDIAGLCVRTDNTRDPWFSPAGFNRGNIKNIVKLAFNPNQAERDVLYRAGVNPVVNFKGQGTVLYGDKTLLAQPSAFDRINVRRLFIVMEKAIAVAAKSSLFEFNDDFTRAAFRNLIEPYLRDIQGRRGIYDFRVVCDTTNNTPEVIDRNEFRGDIYVKPSRSINFIQLNFVAVRTGVEFDEIVGKF